MAEGTLRHARAVLSLLLQLPMRTACMLQSRQTQTHQSRLFSLRRLTATMPIDYNRYPSDWSTRLHRIVWERAQGKCEQCGLAHGQMVVSYKVPRYRGRKRVYRVVWLNQSTLPEIKGAKLVRVILTKAHLDHDATNKHVHPSRLRLWCQLCHLRYDAIPKAARRAASLHQTHQLPLL